MAAWPVVWRFEQWQGGELRLLERLTHSSSISEHDVHLICSNHIGRHLDARQDLHKPTSLWDAATVHQDSIVQDFDAASLQAPAKSCTSKDT